MPLPNRSTASTFDAINKTNNLSIPPANQQTDWDNTKLAPAISDIAGLGLTAPRFWCRFTTALSTGGLVLLNWQAVWMNATSTTPVLSRVTTGEFLITLPTAVSDEYDASFGVTNNITLNLLAADARLEGNVLFGFANASANGNAIIIYTATTSGTPNDLVSNGNGTTIFVKAY